MTSIYLLPLTQGILILVNIAVPALVLCASALLLKKDRRWPSVLMLMGAIALFVLALPTIAMHPLFPVFGRLRAGQLAHLTMMLSILRKVAWLVFAIGLVSYAASQNARGDRS